MSSLTEADWLRIFTDLGVRTETAAKWAPAAAAEWNPALFSRGMDDIRAMLPQVLHECSMFERLSEDLDYTTPERLCEVFPSKFKTLADAQPYLRNPEALANRVYGGRFGNYEPGDGWKYRARSPIGLTFRANYVRMGEVMGQDLEGLPQLIEGPFFGCELVRRWWEGEIPDSMLGETVKMRRVVNGPKAQGLAHVEALVSKVQEVLT